MFGDISIQTHGFLTFLNINILKLLRCFFFYIVGMKCFLNHCKQNNKKKVIILSYDIEKYKT